MLGIGFSIDNVAHYVHAFMSSQAVVYSEEGRVLSLATRKAKVGEVARGPADEELRRSMR